MCRDLNLSPVSDANWETLDRFLYLSKSHFSHLEIHKPRNDVSPGRIIDSVANLMLRQMPTSIDLAFYFL